MRSARLPSILLLPFVLSCVCSHTVTPAMSAAAPKLSCMKEAPHAEPRALSKAWSDLKARIEDIPDWDELPEEKVKCEALTGTNRPALRRDALTRITVSGPCPRPISLMRPKNVSIELIDHAPIQMLAGVTNGVYLEDPENVVISGFEIQGGKTSTQDNTVSGIRVNFQREESLKHSRWVVLHANVVHDLGVDWTAVKTEVKDEHMNAHGIFINNDEPRKSGASCGPATAHPTSVFVLDNAVYRLQLGQSEAIAVNGLFDWADVSHNFVDLVDNIGIDLIGGEDNRGQPRHGRVAHNTVQRLVCGNPAYALDTDNKLCSPGAILRRANAAGIYMDGAYEIAIEDNHVDGFDYGFEVAAERGTCGTSTRGHVVASSNHFQSSNVNCACRGKVDGGMAANVTGVSPVECSNDEPTTLPAICR